MLSLTSTMLLKICLIIGLAVLVHPIFGREKARFDFYRVYEVTAESNEQLDIFQLIMDYPDGYKFLTTPPAIIGQKSQLIIPPHKFGEWSDLVDKYNLKVFLLSNNFQGDIDKEEMRYQRRKAVYDWSSFKRYNETYNWMNELASNSENISTFVVGRSYEGRDIMGLRINVGNKVGKPSIVFEGNIHANEWIGSSTVTFIINEFLTSTDDDVKRLLEHFDWWFVPILNIDGYDYTWNVDRTWRKTRRPTRNPLCHGADPNRNWDVFWGTFGASSNPCSSGYFGDYVFSEPEIKSFADFLGQVPNFFGYISFHSFGRLFMTPYAFTTEPPNDIELLNEIADKAIIALASVRGSYYRLGSISSFFGPTSGSSVDYIILNQAPKIPICFELGTNHILPNEEIINVGKEIFAAIVTVFNETISRGLA